MTTFSKGHKTIFELPNSYGKGKNEQKRANTRRNKKIQSLVIGEVRGNIK